MVQQSERPQQEAEQRREDLPEYFAAPDGAVRSPLRLAKDVADDAERLVGKGLPEPFNRGSVIHRQGPPARNSATLIFGETMHTTSAAESDLRSPRRSHPHLIRDLPNEVLLAWK